MKSTWWLIAVGVLCGCPPQNSKPCFDDTECSRDQRCRLGACGPVCLNDLECGDSQVCRSGLCQPRPECVTETECASGFTCTEGRCQCLGDSSCGTNQQCKGGSCVTRTRCRADTECAEQGGHCEITQGLCLPACMTSTDCAPQLDPQVALALYGCIDRACVRRCINDLTCGGQSIICAANLCRAADCQTLTDCAAGQFCTGAAFGRCLTYTPCTDDSSCSRNWQCKRFETAACPPGFDCQQKLCLEQPQCLTDADCITGVPGTATAKQTGYCGEGHCQPTVSCQSATECAAGLTCIAKICVPTACRGQGDCAGACVDGRCVLAPSPGEINVLRVSPTRGLLEVGDMLRVSLIAFRLDGSSYPLTVGAFTVVDALGASSTNASVTPEGLVTALAGGDVIIRASVPGSALAAVETRLTIVPQVMTGRRVLVVDAATQGPLRNAHVRGCLEPTCDAPSEALTDARGLANFDAMGAGSASFTVVSAQVRSDGLPAFERASIIGTTAAQVYLPLRVNPVKAASGVNGSISFTRVTTSGTYWAGLVATSFGDVPSVKPTDLLGDTFSVQLDLINQKVPVPGALVLYTSAAFGVPQEVKPRSFGFGQAGTRFVVGYAGRGELQQLLTARSIDFLGYLGAFDYALDAPLTLTPQVNVPDTADVNGNGLCTNPQRCPAGTEDVPDYANFTRVSMTPSRPQAVRTELVLPKVVSSVSTVLVSAVQIDPEAGLLPVGFASRTPGAVGSDGLRAVDAVILRSGAPYNGLEIAQSGIWAVATNAQGTGLSGRLSQAASLPPRVVVSPFLPWPAGGSYAPLTKIFSPGQPTWSSVYSSGAELARVSITGTEQRHVLYFAMRGDQTAVAVPEAPSGPGADPTTEAATALEVVTIDLAAGVTPDEVFSLRGVNLFNWVTATDGYARFDR